MNPHRKHAYYIQNNKEEKMRVRWLMFPCFGLFLVLLPEQDTIRSKRQQRAKRLCHVRIRLSAKASGQIVSISNRRLTWYQRRKREEKQNRRERGRSTKAVRRGNRSTEERERKDDAKEKKKGREEKDKSGNSITRIA